MGEKNHLRFAVFCEYQEYIDENGKHVAIPEPIFNVYGIADSHCYRSTLTVEGLKAENIPVPEYPFYEEWKAARGHFAEATEMICASENDRTWERVEQLKLLAEQNKSKGGK